MQTSLVGRVAIVTGVSGDGQVGQAVAKALAETALSWRFVRATKVTLKPGPKSFETQERACSLWLGLTDKGKGGWPSTSMWPVRDKRGLSSAGFMFLTRKEFSARRNERQARCSQVSSRRFANCRRQHQGVNVEAVRLMSALGHKQTSREVRGTSALPPIADIAADELACPL